MSALAALDVGREAPDFKLKGPGGQFVTLSEHRGRKNVVLVFYPLAFSPVCSHQLPTIEKDLPKFRALGAEVLGISVDSHYANTAFAESLGVSFPLLSDFKREASVAYGMLIPETQYSGRGLFLIDKQGRIAYADVSATARDVPSNEKLLAALEALPV
jgi:peroxiredoxin